MAGLQASLRAQATIGPGDLIVGFTDGISEAMSTQSEEWGEERMLQAEGANQYDDMTLVVLRVTA